MRMMSLKSLAKQRMQLMSHWRKQKKKIVADAFAVVALFLVEPRRRLP